MKQRNGFVSNSSSSSFIVGVAKIENLKEATDWIECIDTNYNSEIVIVSSKELSDAAENRWGGLDIGPVVRSKAKDKYRVVSFLGEEEFTIDPSKDEHWFCYCYQGDEGDTAFTTYDEEGNWLDLDYSMDCEDFDPAEREIMSSIWSGSNGLQRGQCHFGAGRNG
jgi:hypothetical protein